MVMSLPTQKILSLPLCRSYYVDNRGWLLILLNPLWQFYIAFNIIFEVMVFFYYNFPIIECLLNMWIDLYFASTLDNN